MVFLGEDYWIKRIPAIPVLQALFVPDDFKKYILATDDIAKAVDFLESFETEETPAQRVTNYLEHEVHGRDPGLP